MYSRPNHIYYVHIHIEYMHNKCLGPSEVWKTSCARGTDLIFFFRQDGGSTRPSFWMLQKLGGGLQQGPAEPSAEGCRSFQPEPPGFTHSLEDQRSRLSWCVVSGWWVGSHMSKELRALKGARD